ncbi:18111_t:CDS:2, partial [Gigaspora rosea]
KFFQKMKPQSIQYEDFVNDLEEIVNNRSYHSDEISETDQELVHDEVASDKRPSSKVKDEDNHIYYMYDKLWKSSRIRKILHHMDKICENIAHVKKVRKRWYDFMKWTDSSKPPDDAPEWTISTNYHPDHSDDEHQNNTDHNNCNNIPTGDNNNHNRSKTLTNKSVIDDNQSNIPTSNNNQSKSHIGIRSSFSRDIQSNTSASKKISGQSSASTREESIQQNTPAANNHYLSDEGSENDR